MRRTNRMGEALFTLGPAGKRYLERLDEDAVALERCPPKQLEHFTGVNDLRLAAESTPGLGYFFACWQLSKLNWSYPIVPDAVFSIERCVFALELDRGMESVRYFVRTKMPYALRASSRTRGDLLRPDGDRDARQVRSKTQALVHRKPEAAEVNRPLASSAGTLTGGDRRPDSHSVNRGGRVLDETSRIHSQRRVLRKFLLSLARWAYDPVFVINHKSMAWRPYENLIDGELDNRVPGRVTGWLRFLRSAQIERTRSLTKYDRAIMKVWSVDDVQEAQKIVEPLL